VGAKGVSRGGSEPDDKPPADVTLGKRLVTEGLALTATRRVADLPRPLPPRGSATASHVLLDSRDDRL
jgi:hypothetical protein